MPTELIPTSVQIQDQGSKPNRRQSVPALCMHYDNPDLMRLIASSISVRTSLEDRMKILKRVNEEVGPMAESDGQVINGVTNGQSDDHSSPDDEILSPEEEEAARAAVLKRTPRRSVQFDDPESVRASNGQRKSVPNIRVPGSFSEERMSYRTALEKLMPSSMVNEFESEEIFDPTRDSISSSDAEIQDNDQDKKSDLSSVADRISKIFQHPGTGKVHVNKFLNAITETGIRMNDPRLHDSMQKLKHVLRRMGTDFESSNNCLLDAEEFKNLIMKDAIFIHRVLRTGFVIAEWPEFCRHIFALHSLCKKNDQGNVSTFIPQLADYDPNFWAVSICSVDGQRFSVGNSDIPFCLQACCRVLNYAIALNDLGADELHSYVGQQPSGRDTRELVLDEDKKPHNPLINSGAIVVTSLLKAKYKHMADRFEAIWNMYEKMAGKERMGFSNTSYLSEREISYRNYALGYFLRENKCLPDGGKLNETLELLLQLYSIEVTCESMAVMAGTFANGGTCPTTGDPVIRSDCVRDVLSLMYSCGLNDFSGKFAFHVGLPAISSISGAIMVVVPNVLGICLWAPRLDQHENSVRAVQFCMELVKIFNFHNYDNLRFQQRKLDPRRMQVETKTQQVVLTLFSAANGDITALRRFLLQGVDLTLSDYDGRTPLHVAASEGHFHCVRFLLQKARVPIRPMDRWQNTPAQDARSHGFHEIADYLDKWHSVALRRCRFSMPAVQSNKVKLIGRPTRSIADSTFTDDCSFLSDHDSGEGVSVVSFLGSPEIENIGALIA